MTEQVAIKLYKVGMRVTVVKLYKVCDSRSVNTGKLVRV